MPGLRTALFVPVLTGIFRQENRLVMASIILGWTGGALCCVPDKTIPRSREIEQQTFDDSFWNLKGLLNTIVMENFL